MVVNDGVRDHCQVSFIMKITENLRAVSSVACVRIGSQSTSSTLEISSTFNERSGGSEATCKARHYVNIPQPSSMCLAPPINRFRKSYRAHNIFVDNRYERVRITRLR